MKHINNENSAIENLKTIVGDRIVKISVAFFLPTERIEHADLSNPEKGNPGIGATQYLFVLVASQLKQRFNNELDIIIYIDGDIKLPPHLNKVKVRDIFEALRLAKKERVDMLVIRTSTEKKVYDFIDAIEQPVIAWSHNRIWGGTANLLANCKFIKRNICVGIRQSLELADHNLYKKTSVIYNPISVDKKFKRDIKHPTVTFIGHIDKARGFHKLAEIWKDVLKEVPNAKLKVIGSAALYNRNVKLGSLGIASEKYERLFKRYITDSNGKVHSSVEFLGVMGQEKENIFLNTTVGVINPLGYETLGLSGIEMEACTIPLVTINKYGQSEIVEHNYSGFLFNSRIEFKKYIIKLLLEKEKNEEFGVNAQIFVENKFGIEKVIEHWVKEIRNIYFDLPAESIGIDFKLNRLEKLSLFLGNIKKNRCFYGLPSIINIKTIIKNIFLKLLRK